LISPYALAAVNKDKQNVTIHLTKKQIEDSPSLSSNKPVSRQFEEAYYGYFGWPLYWTGPYVWGEFPDPLPVRKKPDNRQGYWVEEPVEKEYSH